jgi:hypothetical protein
MKKTIKKVALLCVVAACLSSCYPYRDVVGSGAAGTTKVSHWNHYLVGGLIPVGVSDSKSMAAGATNYTVYTRHSFINSLLGGITLGIYTPTTTTVTK